MIANETNNMVFCKNFLIKIPIFISYSIISIWIVSEMAKKFRTSREQVESWFWLKCGFGDCHVLIDVSLKRKYWVLINLFYKFEKSKKDNQEI